MSQHPVALITGGAGGIGSAISLQLAQAGMQVVVGYHRSADAAQHLDKVRAEPAGDAPSRAQPSQANPARR